MISLKKRRSQITGAPFFTGLTLTTITPVRPELVERLRALGEQGSYLSGSITRPRRERETRKGWLNTAH